MPAATNGVNQELRLKWTKSRPEGYSKRETGEYIGGVVPEQELDQDGRTAEKPNVDPRAPGDDRVGREAHNGQQDPEQDPTDHGHCGQGQGYPEPLQDAGRKEIVVYDVPLETFLGNAVPLDVGEEQRMYGHYGQETDHRRRHPASRVA